MHGKYIKRFRENDILKALLRSPVVCLLGPRQCGKSTLVQKVLADWGFVYLDLQRTSDLSILSKSMANSASAYQCS